jgi:Zn-dependent alcohol dehydrogenases
LGRGIGTAAAGAARCRDHLRASRRAGPLALRAVRKAGRVVCAGIHMSDIPSFPYRMLWEERQLLSVANLTRHDGIEFFKIVAQAGIRTHTTAFALREANEVLSRLRAGQITGAAVLQP